MEQINAKIFGRVQGVGFRYAIQRAAEKLNLKGWVKNQTDGSVEVMAVGDKDNLEKFLEWAYRGTIFSKVEKIKVIRQERKQKLIDNFQRFEIK